MTIGRLTAQPPPEATSTPKTPTPTRTVGGAEARSCAEWQRSSGFPGQPRREAQGAVASGAIVTAWSILQQTC